MINLEEAHSALNFINPSCDRATWIRVGMGLKDAGLEVDDFIEWSKGGSNFDSEKDCINTWNSFHDGEVTKATLFALARENGWRQNSNLFSNKKITDCRKEKVSKWPRQATVNTYALEIWERCIFAPDSHEYIVKKQGNSDGLRIYPADAPDLIINSKNVKNYLVVPCFSSEKLQTLQFIPANGGEKLNLPRASFDDGYFIVGKFSKVIYIVESIGNAWAINNTTNAVAIVCFGAGRMMQISKIIRNKFPDSTIVIIPDRGKEILAEKIATEIFGQWIELPSDKPQNYDVNDYVNEHGNVALTNLLANSKIPELRYKLLSVDEVCESPPMEWIVKRILPKEGLAALYGPSGSGKSFLLLDMALTIATGKSCWFGHRINSVPITYVCLEGEAGLGKRVKAWLAYANKVLPKSIRFVIQPFNLLTDDVEELFRAMVLAGHTGGMTILDTLNRAAPGADENSSVDMGKIIFSSGKLQRLTKGMVLFAHHTGKDETKKLRGHSSLPAALDGAIEVTKNGAGRQWAVAKSKDDKDGDTYPFELQIVPLGTDKDGDAITSCVVAERDEQGASIKRSKKPRGDNQKIVFDALGELFKKSSCWGKSDAPDTKACLEYYAALEHVRGLLPCDKKHQKERVEKAITGLVSSGFLKHRDGWLWVP